VKRIKIEAADKILYAKPLMLDQLEDHESLINEIVSESGQVSKSGSDILPVSLLKKQATIVTLGLQNHDSAVTDAVVQSFSIMEIARAFAAVVSGSGLEEVPEGEAAAGR